MGLSSLSCSAISVQFKHLLRHSDTVQQAIQNDIFSCDGFAMATKNWKQGAKPPFWKMPTPFPIKHNVTLVQPNSYTSGIVNLHPSSYLVTIHTCHWPTIKLHQQQYRLDVAFFKCTLPTTTEAQARIQMTFGIHKENTVTCIEINRFLKNVCVTIKNLWVSEWVSE